MKPNIPYFKKIKLTRFSIFFMATILIAFVILIQYMQVMLFHSSNSFTQTSLKMSTVERGPILDRNGKSFALTTSREAATVWLPDVKNRNVTAGILANLWNLNKDDLLKKWTAGPNFQYIKKELTLPEATAFRQALADAEKKDYENAKQVKKGTVIAKWKDLFKGIHLEPRFARVYPQQQIAAQIIGYVGTDNIGLAGLEYSYNDILGPQEKIDQSKSQILVGSTMYTTLDSVYQYEVEKILNSAKETNSADRVNALVLDAKTADILVWATSPTFDLNHFSDFDDTVRSNPLLTNYYEPGSVFKIFSLSSLMDAGVLNPKQTFNCPGIYERKTSGGEVIRIRDLAPYGILDVQGILVHSSNVGTAQASDLMDAKSFEGYVRNWGFGQITGINLVGETPGYLRSSSNWSSRSKATIAMGQEIGVGALQMVTAATAFANDGVMIRPHILKKIQSSSGEIQYQSTREEIRRVLKPETAHLVLDMMKNTVDEGGSHLAKIENLEIAGKTGTAQVRDPKTGRYSDTNYIASILLYVPADHPQFIIYLTMEDPRGESYLAGRVAAPVAKQIALKLVQLSGLPRSDEPVIEHSGVTTLPAIPTVNIENVMPDLTGASKRTLLPLLQRKDLKVQMRGDGWVTKQSPPPGTLLTDNMIIQLELE